MKKSAFVITAMVLVIFVIAASFRPARVAQGPKTIPDSVYAVFEKSCIGCHSSSGNKMAASHVNFDNWDTYSKDKQADKVADISKVMNKGAMPPAGFRKNNPGKVPSPADVAKVTAWAKTF
jgi:mono/diheme cytochrome c family protein